MVETLTMTMKFENGDNHNLGALWATQ